MCRSPDDILLLFNKLTYLSNTYYLLLLLHVTRKATNRFGHDSEIKLTDHTNIITLDTRNLEIKMKTHLEKTI